MVQSSSRMAVVAAFCLCLFPLSLSADVKITAPDASGGGKKATDAAAVIGVPVEPLNPVEGRFRALRERLNLTAEQANSLDAVQAIMANNAKVYADTWKGRDEAVRKKMDAALDIRSYAQVRQVNVDGVKQLAVAFDAFYRTLSVEQKKIADEIVMSYSVKGSSWATPYADKEAACAAFSRDLPPKDEGAAKK